jgi:hypothetical protein
MLLLACLGALIWLLETVSSYIGFETPSAPNWAPGPLTPQFVYFF